MMMDQIGETKQEEEWEEVDRWLSAYKLHKLDAAHPKKTSSLSEFFGFRERNSFVCWLISEEGNNQTPFHSFS